MALSSSLNCRRRLSPWLAPRSRQVLAGRRAELGDKHNDTAASMGSLALLLEDRGRLADAEAARRECCDACAAALGAAHPQTAECRDALVGLLVTQRKLAEVKSGTAEQTLALLAQPK